LRDMRRYGIKPAVTSTWRSSAIQAGLHKCSYNRRCRLAHPGLYRAMAAGSSVHEAGFAVDISGVANGRRGEKQLTPRGRRIVRIMRKNGFAWRYGLRDPVHFEADPRRYGYRSVSQAIKLNQTRCQIRLAARRAGAKSRNSTHASVGRSHTQVVGARPQERPSRRLPSSRRV
jgi:hypothetical protein